MKNFILFLTITVCLFHLNCSDKAVDPVEQTAEGDWEKIPVLSELVNCLEVDAQGNLWVGTGSGVYFSPDKGKTWNERFAGLGSSDEIINIRISSGGKIYAASESELYVYNNSASAWVNISINVQTNLIAFLHRVHSFSVDSNGDIFAGMFISEKNNPSDIGMDHSAYFKSENNGASWTRISITQFEGGVTHTFFNSSHDIFIVMDGVIYKSADEGSTWNQSSTGINWSLPKMIRENSKGILFMATGNGVYKSTNNGANWIPTSYSTLTQTIEINQQDKIFIGAINKCFVSEDNVSTTTDFSEGLEHSLSGFSDCSVQTVDGDGYVYATLEGVLYRTSKSTLN